MDVLYYVYPAVVFTFLAVSNLVVAFKVQSTKQIATSHRNLSIKRVILLTLGLLLSTYLGQIIGIGIYALARQRWTLPDHIVVGRLSCFLVFGIQLIQFLESDLVAWNRLEVSFALSFIFETAIALLTIFEGETANNHVQRIIDVAVSGLRCFFLASTLVLLLIAQSIQNRVRDPEDEQASLLPKTSIEGDPTANSYGTSNQNDRGPDNEEEHPWVKRHRLAAEAMQKRLQEGGTWFQYLKRFAVLLPYVWPFGNSALQLRIVGVVMCLLASNALHLLIPRQTAIVMDSFGKNSNTNSWLAVLTYAGLRLISSDCGVELLRQVLWTPVKYYAQEALSRAAFSHIMHLSADFHDSKSSSDMLMAIQGGSSISNAIESVLLQACPMLIDMTVAVLYLSIKFGPYEGFITIATGIVFLHFATRLVGKSKEFSRRRRNALYSEHQLRHAGLLGWQTVSAFNQIGYEDNRHADAVAHRWLKEQQYAIGWHVSIAFQTVVLTSGLLASAFLAAHQIQAGRASPGQFAMLLMYWSQLTSPLQFFARLGKSMSDDFINAERLLEVMTTEPSVQNKAAARPLKFISGSVEFENVSFSYDKQKSIINSLNLVVPGGEKVALVGATGAGKSTILKLLFRYYDVVGGSLRVDGQDVRDVDIFSLRDRIGIVPQSPVLFDDTIMNNVRYGRITATDEEVFEACRAACIHDKIMAFTGGKSDFPRLPSCLTRSIGYSTRVGERGVKLSGGELQRVAIARAILKNPDIVLLDEATSAVDTDTEQHIQRSFERLCEGRTTFIVAHRLSTIKSADRIIVVEKGAIVEQGNHNDLILSGGRYADLWSKQGFGGQESKIESVVELQTQVVHGDHLSGTAQSSQDPQTGSGGSGGAKASDNARVDGSLSTPTTHRSHELTLSTDDHDTSSMASKLNPVAPAFTPRSVIASTESTERWLDDKQKHVVPTTYADMANAKDDACSSASERLFENSTKAELEDLASTSNENNDKSNVHPTLGGQLSLRKAGPSSSSASIERTRQILQSDGGENEPRKQYAQQKMAMHQPRRVSAPPKQPAGTIPCTPEFKHSTKVVLRELPLRTSSQKSKLALPEDVASLKGITESAVAESVNQAIDVQKEEPDDEKKNFSKLPDIPRGQRGGRRVRAWFRGRRGRGGRTAAVVRSTPA